MWLLAAMVVVALQDAPASDTTCVDDNGVERCLPVARAKDLAMFGAPSIEADAAAGAEVYRVLQIDGYGNALPIIAFERRPGSSPRVIVYGKSNVRLEGGVPLDVWNKVAESAELADRILVKETPDKSLNVCLHAWITTVEMANAPDGPIGATPVRRKAEDACGNGLTTRFGTMVAAEAVRLLPECDVLDPDQHRNDAARLAVCTTLSGDRSAAAELMNQVGWGQIRPREDLERSSAWDQWLGSAWNARIIWNGETIQNESSRGREPIGPFLTAKEAEYPEMKGYLTGFTGVSARRVETVGEFRYSTGASEGATVNRAAFRQIWTWSGLSRVWQLDTWTVDPFIPAD